MVQRVRTPALIALLVATLAAALVLAAPAGAAFPGQNGKIVFAGTRDAQLGLFSISPEGTDLTRLTSADDREPSFSPTGDRIVFSSVRENSAPQRRSIWQIHPDGTGIVRLTPAIPNVIDRTPSFSPDGLRIVFARTEAPDIDDRVFTNIYTMKADGTDLQQVTVGDSTSTPRFSADGLKILYRHFQFSGNPETSGLYTVNPNGTGKAKVPGTGGEVNPDFSPDGTKIVTGSDHIGDEQRLFVMGADGSGQAQVTLDATGAEEFLPAYSPDGQRIVFKVRPAGGSGPANGLHVVSPDGTGDVQITTAAGDTSPTWGPPTEVPVIFIPGILGSEIWCTPATRSDKIWPDLGVDGDQMQLATDGETNAAADCPDAGVAEPVYNPADHRLVPGQSGISEALIAGLKDIYGSALTQLTTLVGPRNLYAFPWDWRRDTASSLARLDALVDRVITETGAPKVQIIAHSYGGLLTLHYAESPARRAKLARVTSVGSPYLGSPKSTFPLLTGGELPFDTGLADAFEGTARLQKVARTLRGLFNLWPAPVFGRFLSVQGRTPKPLDDAGTAQLIADAGAPASIWLDAQARHVDTYDRFDIGDLPWRLIISGGVPTIRSVQLFPGSGGDPDTAGITLAAGDGTVPLRSQTLLHDDPAQIPGTHSDVAFGELCASEHGGQMSDAALYPLIEPFVVRGSALDPARSTPCRRDRAVVLDVIDGDLAFGASTTLRDGAPRTSAAAAGPLSVEEAEAADLVDVVRDGRQTLVLADPDTPVSLRIGPLPGATLGLTVLDVNGDTSTTVVPKTSSTAPLTVAVAGGTGNVVTDPPSTPVVTVPQEPPPGFTPTVPITPAPGPALKPVVVPPPSVDRRAPTVRVTVKRSGRRYRVTVTAKDASGIKAISYRLGTKGKAKRYSRTLTLSAADVRRLRVSATDKRGNRSREVTAKLPKGKR